MKFLVRRRPTASLVISVVALFVALGGVSYAAFQAPPGSVGTLAIKNGAVTNPKIRNLAVNFNKIAYGTVGIRRINIDQVQTRVYGNCSGSTGAIGSINNVGKVTCNSTLPDELGTSSSAVAVNSTASTVVTRALPSGASYLVFANPYATITGTAAGQQVQVACTLSADGASTTRTISAEVGASTRTIEQAIPIVLPAPSPGPSAGTAALSCTQTSTPATPAPTVSVQSTLNAIQTASNT
jgi:trimeric autotransporter adhesin